MTDTASYLPSRRAKISV